MLQTRDIVAMLIGVLLLLAGVAIGYFLPHQQVHQMTEEHAPPGTYVYISPLLSCGDLNNIPQRTVQSAQQKVESYVEQEKNSGDAEDIAIYFRELKNGSSFAVNNNITFSPGSLLKVPLLMAALDQAETNPAILAKTITYTGDQEGLQQEVLPSQKLEKGKTYTLNDLLELMIATSANNAANETYGIVGAKAVSTTFTELGLTKPDLTTDYTLTVKDYATFFRILYNSTYLSPAMSERALALLAKSEFKNGLVAGVPTGTPVAHKFGEREIGDMIQLHDCGIVYAETNPYILCVMTRGSDMDTLEKIIQDISRITYTEVAKAKK